MTADNDKEADQLTSVGAGNDETTIVAPPTEAAPTLAYSDEPAGEDPGSWREAFGRAALPLFIAAAVLLVFLVSFWVWLKWPTQQEKVIVENTMTTVMTAPPTWTPPVVVTSTVPVTSTVTVQAAPAKTADPEVDARPTTVTVQSQPTLSRDDEFIERLQADQLVIRDRTKAIASARWVCRQLAAGRTQADIVAASEPDHPSVTHLGMVDFVAASADFYCPEYAGS